METTAFTLSDVHAWCCETWTPDWYRVVMETTPGIWFGSNDSIINFNKYNLVNKESEWHQCTP
jgi:hypothetical protein